MPGKVKVKIIAGRNLPVMDRGSETTDAYVEIKLGTITHKTDVCRKSLNPQWNSDWYRFEVDDAELQDEPLQIRLMDYDTYSANDAIGKVYINLNPLLIAHTSHTGKGSVMSGWIPVYDTMHGIRGEVNLIVKVDLFSDLNKFRQSSCGVQFFHSQNIPHGYHAQLIHGFVEELVVNDDPEYQWIDKIRTPRASNEARLVAFLKLSGQVQRKIGLKAIDLGGNAVIGYNQCFDLEGDVGVVARGIGTAVTLVKIHETITQPIVDSALVEENESLAATTSVSPNNPNNVTSATTTTTATSKLLGPATPRNEQAINCKLSSSQQSPAKIGTPGSAVIAIGKENSNYGMCRRSSDSDLSITPKGNSLNERTSGFMRVQTGPLMKPAINHENLDMLEYPFITMGKYPNGFILHLGATVAARSVKLLERVPNPDEPETRDSWWNEIRMEIRSHARALGCNVVLGYSELTSITDDVCVLSATGTAAVVNLQYGADLSATITHLDVSGGSSKSSGGGTATKDAMTTSLDRQEFDITSKLIKEKEPLTTIESDSELTTNNNKENNSNSMNGLPTQTAAVGGGNASQLPTVKPCSMCHVPYMQGSVPFRISMLKCAICRRGKVPDVLLATIEMPETLQVTGRGCLLQAHVCRPKRDLRSESNAKEISDGLPFLEYELHKLLICKLKVKGMNAIFGLRTTVTVGEKMIAMVATATAVFLTALQPPVIPKVVAGNSWTDTEKLMELQRSIHDTVDKNREIYQLKTFQEYDMNNGTASKQLFPSDTDDSDDELTELDLTVGNKDSCVLEVDDIQDLEVISHLMEGCPPDGFHVVNTQAVPGLHDLEVVKNLQMFTQIWRAKLTLNHGSKNFSRHFQRLLQTIYFKLRTMMPCAICDLRFRLDFPEPEEIQLMVTGVALGLGEPGKLNKAKRKIIVHSVSKDAIKRVDDDMIFNLDEDQITEVVPTTTGSTLSHSGSLKIRKKSPIRGRLGSGRLTRHLPTQQRERYGVDITPLSYVPGGKIDKYLGNLNFFFIRESTSVRENGGICGFVHSFVTELLAVVRAHVTSLGGNAMIAFYMTELMLVDNPHKNQGQCLISVGGDVVFVSYFNDD